MSLAIQPAPSPLPAVHDPRDSAPRVNRYRDQLPSIYRQQAEDRRKPGEDPPLREIERDAGGTPEDVQPLREVLRAMGILLGPIEYWLAQAAAQLDPKYAPDNLLLFLADWVALDLNEHFAIQARNTHRLRRLIPAAFPGYRQRGTLKGMTDMLDALLADKPWWRARITPRTSMDFVLGPDNLLGRGVALGIGNAPHEFSVEIQMPEGDALDEITEAEIRSLLESEKPAHTYFTLLEPVKLP